MKTMISNLPVDLIEDIISRVPLKYMGAVRSTCTNWNTLSKSQRFTRMHNNKAPPAESQMIVMVDNYLYLMSLFVSRYRKLKGQRFCLDKQVKISYVFHCQGLLLCMLKEDHTKVLVWSPYCGQRRWIETRFSLRRPYEWSEDPHKYAIGYVNKNNKYCRRYKILRMFDTCVRGERFLWYEIYDFDSGLWTTLDVGTPHWRPICQQGLSLKGNTYWCAFERNSDYENQLDHHIICFDFTSETFGPLLRMPFSAGFDESVTLSCVREEKLAVLLTHFEENPYKIDIWITNKIEAEKISWSKFLTVNRKPHPISTDSYFIDEENKIVMGFYEIYATSKPLVLSIVGEDKYLRKVDLGERRAKENCTRTHGCSYVPSLVELEQPAGGKRKRQSELEKSRCDEKMSRLVALGLSEES